LRVKGIIYQLRHLYYKYFMFSNLFPNKAIIADTIYQCHSSLAISNSFEVSFTRYFANLVTTSFLFF